jgi:glycerol-3-phosphate O-acyltransferase
MAIHSTRANRGLRTIAIVRWGPRPALALPGEPAWPDDAPLDGPLVVLADASSRLELDLIQSWVRRHLPGGVDYELIRLAPSRRRRLGQRTEPRLEPRLRRGDDPYVLPVRVVWSPFLRDGRRTVSWADLARLGDPRDPDALRQQVIVRRWPDRVAILPGPGATAGRLIADHAGSVEVTTLTDFVTRRAWLALERAERRMRGNRYKVPRFLRDEMTSRADFQDGAIRYGQTRGLGPELAIARARHYLREMAAQHSTYLIDLIANAIHWLYRQGYGEIVYDREKVAAIATLGQEVPLAFLPSHRSNLDRLALQFLKWENDLPPNHTAGGINMNFFPVGPLVRRTGVFFIRRSFRDNELYKFVLRSYLDYLVENRFPLEWYLEGGRSRSGMLLRPKLGLLSYVVGSWRRGKSDDILLIPVSIAYDQIQDLGSYASEARGEAKQKESFSWALSAIRSLRRRYGNIHIRFGEPVSVAKALASAPPDDSAVDVTKLAFEVMTRIAQVTPITPASLVSIALLNAGRPCTSAELAAACAELDRYVEERSLPTTEPLHLDSPAEVKRVLDLLAEHGNVTSDRSSPPTFHLTTDQALRASYYRNMIVHHFIARGIGEMALAAMERPDQGEFWDRVNGLRELLRFEFFFPDREEFREAVRLDLEGAVPGWELADPRAVLARLAPRVAAWSVAPILDSYLVVADELAAAAGAVEDKPFIAACLARGERYRSEGVVTAASVSAVAYRQGLALAHQQGLTGPDAGGGRESLASEVRDLRGAPLIPG